MLTEVSTAADPRIAMDPAIRLGKLGVMIAITEDKESGIKLSFRCVGRHHNKMK
jgi:hypothetical protein